MKILMVTSEMVPFAKVGGLGDVVGALAPELARQGHDVRVVMPRYYGVDPGRLEPVGGPLGVPVGGGEVWARLVEGRAPGSDVPVYFVDNEVLYGRDGVYGDRAEPAFGDNLLRFGVLSRGALQTCKLLGWTPDVLHAHDWPSAPAPVFLNLLEPHGDLEGVASVLTIHNLGYQGVFPKDQFPILGLGWEQFHGAGFEWHDAVNLLKAGLRAADVLTTVSPTYAAEIRTPAFGEGLDGLLRHRAPDLYGVLNGIDYEMWNPATDPHLPAHYDHDDLAGKAVCKEALQRELGLPVDPAIPVYGVVSRLADQKGFGDLCGPSHGSLYAICSQLDVQVVVLGTGEEWCEAELASLASRLPNLRVRLEFDNPLAHLIEAGSDFFLMPSKYEPCGLNQMYSLRYGTLPIVRRTGGLADTVANYDEATGEGTGFVLDHLGPSAIFDTVGWSLWAYHHRPEHVEAMRRRAMRLRFDWKTAAASYTELYQWAVDRKQGRTPRVW